MRWEQLGNLIHLIVCQAFLACCSSSSLWTLVTEQQHAHYPADIPSSSMEGIFNHQVWKLEKQKVSPSGKELRQWLLIKALRDRGHQNAVIKVLRRNISIPLIFNTSVKKICSVAGITYSTACPSTRSHRRWHVFLHLSLASLLMPATRHFTKKKKAAQKTELDFYF